MPRTRTCRGKTRYRDAAEAKEALRRFKTRSTRQVIPTRWYDCGRCGGVHLARRAA